MLTINTNLSSLIAQNSLKTSTNKLNLAIERMTTGYKINHSKDNAANYSIVTNMNSKISSYMVAEDNCAMGLDMLTTATESLDLIYDKLTRLRDLAEQSSNGTYGEQSLKAINSEANALVDEINRIYSTVEYNGLSVLDSARGAGCDMESLPEVTSSGFIKEVKRRDTSNMTRLEDVAIDQALTSGTYSISTPDELVKLSTMTKNQLIGEDTEFVLANDIDLGAISNWEPIGGYGSVSSKAFKATFDGNGYKIKNLKHDTEIYGYSIIGLFGYVANATFKNLGVENASITNKKNDGHTGIMFGKDSGTSTVDNCYSTGSLNARMSAGGLVGAILEKSTIKDSYADVDIIIQNDSVTQANYGGLVGANHGKIINCFATGDVTGCDDAFNLGGLAGSSSGLISNCYATGNVTGEACIGGLVGWLPGNEGDKIGLVENCYSSGDVVLNGHRLGATGNPMLARAGGLFGSAVETDVRNCSSKSNVTTTLLDTFTISALGTCYKSSRSLVSYENVSITGCTYDSSVNPGIKATEGTIVSTNVFDKSIVGEKVALGLQVGIDASENSRILLESSVKIGGLYSLKNLGLDDKNYISIIDNILLKVSEKQVEYGSVQNRLESALTEIETQYSNLVSSRSTLRDADIAETSSQYIQQQILQQASATLLATANQSPSIALQLI